jgi:hypothetical protein
LLLLLFLLAVWMFHLTRSPQFMSTVPGTAMNYWYLVLNFAHTAAHTQYNNSVASANIGRTANIGRADNTGRNADFLGALAPRRFSACIFAVHQPTFDCPSKTPSSTTIIQPTAAVTPLLSLLVITHLPTPKTSHCPTPSRFHTHWFS